MRPNTAPGTIGANPLVNVDLAAGRAWGGFGPDRLTGVEDAVSGNGRDVLRGGG